MEINNGMYGVQPTMIDIDLTFDLSNALTNSELMKSGIETFDDKEIFLARLNEKSLAFGCKPIELVADGKINEIMNELGRIQYGIFA